jgi:DUF4097 and DUF4098 domain-containing protein YvlB
VEDIEGQARIVSSNGSIRLVRHAGNVNAKTSNSSIEAHGLVGDLVAVTSNGSIKADGMKGAFEAETSNSSIVARVDNLPAGRPVKADTSNGSIDLALADVSGQPVDLATSNSSITLRLPAGANAEVRASTSNASISNDFDLTSTGASSKNRLEGRIGAGGAPIRLSSSNGGIRIQKL